MAKMKLLVGAVAGQLQLPQTPDAKFKSQRNSTFYRLIGLESGSFIEMGESVPESPS